MARTSIFVYGTLLRGEVNHHLLGAASFVAKARTAAQFELVEFGTYPGLVEGGRTSVDGELYLVDDATREQLDRLEGHPWLYERRSIELDDGSRVEAYLVERRNLGRTRVIAGGSFRAWRRVAVALALAWASIGTASAEKRRDAGVDAAHSTSAAAASAASASAAASAAALSSAAGLASAAPVADAPSTTASETQKAAPAALAPVQEPVPESAGAQVRLRDALPGHLGADRGPIFTVRIPWGGKSAQERARQASEALQKVVDAKEPQYVRVDDRGDVAIVYVGERPIIQLGRDDALAAGDVSLGVHANTIASKIRDGFQSEQKRSSLLKIGITLLAALVSGILALFLLRRIGRLWRATRSWLHEHPDRVPALRVQSIEVVRPRTLRLVLAVSARVIALFLQVGIAYGWLLFSLYIFEPTREYTGRLTDMVLMPLSGLMSKTVTALPTLIIGAASVVALLVLLRFVGLFFESAGRGDTSLGWVSPDHAAATSLVVRFTIVVVFLVAAIPYITGAEDSSLARVGLVAIVALGLAATPMLASMCVGIAVVYGRGLHPGEFVSFGSHSGRIETITLLELRLRDALGCELRVPHLLCLFFPLRVTGKARPVTATIAVTSNTPQAPVRQLLLEVAMTVGTEPEIELVGLDQGGAAYRVTVRSEAFDAQHRLYCVLGDALAERAIPLGTFPRP